MTEIYLIRHGEAEGNVYRRLHGQYNSLLTPRGQQQVKCVEKRFEQIPIDACYASDLTRASLTARAVYVPKKLRLRRDARFREVDVGRWEDIPFGFLEAFESEQMRLFDHDPKSWHVAGAERFEEYTARFLEAMTEAAQENEGKTIAIFSHGAIMRGVLLRLFSDGQDTLPLSDNTGVSKLYWRDGAFTYEYLNDSSHLPKELTRAAFQAWWRETGRKKEANLYFVPEEENTGTRFTAMLGGQPIGAVRLGEKAGEVGRILGMSLLPEYLGRFYGDQFLGCAVSYFRRLGCKTLELAPGDYPDSIESRYGFDPLTRQVSIDAEAFDWNAYSESIAFGG